MFCNYLRDTCGCNIGPIDAHIDNIIVSNAIIVTLFYSAPQLPVHTLILKCGVQHRDDTNIFNYESIVKRCCLN